MRFRQLFAGIDEPAYVVRDEDHGGAMVVNTHGAEFTPPEHPVSLDPPRQNVRCGYLYGDGIMCHEPAGPDHEHPRDDAPKVHPSDLDILCGDADPDAAPTPPPTGDYVAVLQFEDATYTRSPGEGAWTQVAGRDPAPGLVRTINGEVPPWAEMRAKYPPLPWRKVDPEALRAKLPAPRAKWADLLGVPSGIAAAGVAAMGNAIRAAAEAEQEQRRGEVLGATDQGEVDFRHMLKDDAAAWSAKARIEKVLGRPYLATQLADQLAPDTAAALADRLESLVSQAVAETEMRISEEMSRVVTRKMAEIRQERSEKVQAVSRERFNTPSRFS